MTFLKALILFVLFLASTYLLDKAYQDYNFKQASREINCASVSSYDYAPQCIRICGKCPSRYCMNKRQKEYSCYCRGETAIHIFNPNPDPDLYYDMSDQKCFREGL